jgi:hypothetical protein
MQQQPPHQGLSHERKGPIHPLGSRTVCPHLQQAPATTRQWDSLVCVARGIPCSAGRG